MTHSQYSIVSVLLYVSKSKSCDKIRTVLGIFISALPEPQDRKNSLFRLPLGTFSTQTRLTVGFFPSPTRSTFRYSASNPAGLVFTTTAGTTTDSLLFTFRAHFQVPKIFMYDAIRTLRILPRNLAAAIDFLVLTLEKPVENKIRRRGGGRPRSTQRRVLLFFTFLVDMMACRLSVDARSHPTGVVAVRWSQWQVYVRRYRMCAVVWVCSAARWCV